MAALDGVTIGISGAPESTVGTGSAKAIARCRALGLDALEIAWVHRVTITPSGAQAIRSAAEANDIQLSVHAPYYVNLNSRDPRKRAASAERILASARGAAWSGASDVVLHLAFYHGDPPAVVLGRLVEQLGAITTQLHSEGVGVTLRPELAGGRAEFGDLGEILALCAEVPGLAPCIDAAHLHARSGGSNTAAEFRQLWRAISRSLGDSALGNAHVHLSGIAYGPKGEIRHLGLIESDLDYRAFLATMRQLGVRGRVIVESPARERDALLVAEAWRAPASAGGQR